ncbi:c-type cytochrome [Halomonas sp. HK25]|uniref:c-type cytochrome n=1 Tax=Halomonas sp. HK25 TaxID=3394321 RepID=UPI0039FC3FD6
MAQRLLPSSRRRLLTGLALSAGLASPLAVADDPDRIQGERLFRNQCVGCHSLASGVHIAGPSLHALIGRPAGSLSGFGYSLALEEADFVWNAETLDAFLAAPADFLPGNRMVLWGLGEGPRRQIIRYLDALASDAEP